MQSTTCTLEDMPSSSLCTSVTYMNKAQIVFLWSTHTHTSAFSLYPSFAGCPDTGPQVITTPEIQPGSATITWQATQTDDPLLATGMRYAIYSRCGSENSFQLVAENIEGLSYTVTSLPAPSQCVLRVVAYHKYCLRDLDGGFKSESFSFTTAIAGKETAGQYTQPLFIHFHASLFSSSNTAPMKPPPPNITVGNGMFTIDGLQAQDVVVEYVCNYISTTTGITSQVRMKPSETTDVPVEEAGEYQVQVGALPCTASWLHYINSNMVTCILHFAVCWSECWQLRGCV